MGIPMRYYPKPIKKALRDLAGEAYERELRHELGKLDKSFNAWRSGELTSGELNDRIHDYESGPAREMFKRYNSGLPDVNVASAVAVGLLVWQEIPADVLNAIEDMITLFKSERS
jgi:hypothetical protein